MQYMMVFYLPVVVFILGTVVGSFLNVCIARLPLEKSVLWPGSRCGSCLQRIRWYDNLPLISYLWLRGRCRTCDSRFSVRYFVIEFLTGLGFVGLFYAEITCNIHDWPVPPGRAFEIAHGKYPVEWLFVWLVRAILFSFLLTAACCDIDGREIPLSLTLTGTVVGLVAAVLLPWPWPLSLADDPLPQLRPGIPANLAWMDPTGGLKSGVYPWPVWGPLPSWLPPGSWQLGLATGLAGVLAGTFMMRGIGFLFSRGLGKEALGLGDADLMMMAGAFLGWQPIVAAFFLSVFPALIVGILNIVIKRDNSLPFGPSLAAAIIATFLCWRWIGPHLQPVFFSAQIMGALVVLGAVFMLVSSCMIRLLFRRG
jgi:leader peptidase (prepilin peptidase) / N-methyltransferase